MFLSIAALCHDVTEEKVAQGKRWRPLDRNRGCGTLFSPLCLDVSKNIHNFGHDLSTCCNVAQTAAFCFFGLDLINSISCF